MTRVAGVLVVGTLFSIVLLPGRAAAQGLPQPALRADFGASRIQIRQAEPVIRGHRQASIALVARTVPVHRVVADGPFLQHQIVPQVDCTKRTAPSDSRAAVPMGHRTAGTPGLIHIVPVTPCAPRR